jgi:hypothetical protein
LSPRSTEILVSGITLGCEIGIERGSIGLITAALDCSEAGVWCPAMDVRVYVFRLSDTAVRQVSAPVPVERLLAIPMCSYQIKFRKYIILLMFYFSFFELYLFLAKK